MSFRRRALFLAGLFVAVSCSDAGNPLTPEGPEQPEPGDAPVSMLQGFICTANVVGVTEACVPDGPAMGDVPGAIVISNQAYVQVVATTVLNSADSMHRETRLVNLMPHAMGTTDGVNAHPYGIRVWLEAPINIVPTNPALPTAIEVANEYGTMSWNASFPSRPYFWYQEMVEPGETSSLQTFRFAQTNVTSFQYKVYVATEVQFPKGRINITPDNPVVDSGSVDTLVAQVRGAWGQVHSEAAGLTWTSTDPSVVSVLELAPKDTLAQITAHKEGQAWVKVWSSTAADASARRDSVLVTVNSAPVVLQDTSAAVSNVTVSRPAGRLLAKASDPSGQPLSVVPATVASADGGEVVIAANGGFTYLSAADSSGTDSFQFQVTDGVRTTTGTMVVNVLPSSYWYVRAGAEDGDGRDRYPFGSVGDAQAKAGANDTIIVLPSASSLDEGVVLKSGQGLIGAGIPTPILFYMSPTDPAVVLAPGGMPNLTRTTAGSTVTVAQNNVIRGLAIDHTGGTAIGGSNFVSLVINDVSVEPTGPALDLSNGTVNAKFITLSAINSTSGGILLTNVNGSVVVDGLGPISIVGPGGGPAVSVSGGNVRLSYGGNITQGTSFPLLAVSNHADSITLGGALTATSGTGMQFSNADGTYAFNGTVNLAGGDAGVDVIGTSDGSFLFANASIANPSGGPALNVFGGTPGLFYRGSITHNTGRAVVVDGITADSVVLRAAITSGTAGTPTGLGILVQNVAGGLVALDSVKSLFTSGSPAVTLNNAGGTVRFGHAMDITTTIGAGFTASGAGAVSVTGTNSVATGTGTPVTLTSVNTGTAGVSFSSVSTSAGAVNGVFLNGITGVGFQATGGTISGTTGPAVQLTNTNGADSVSLRGMTLSRGGGTGAVISGSNFGKLHALNTSVTATGGPGALALTTGTMSGTYSVVSSNASTGSGVSLTGVNGTFNASGGSINTAGAAAFALSGGNVGGTISGAVAQASAIPLLSIAGDHSGTFTFAGNVTATNGNGLQFTNADGTYNFTGSLSLAGGDAGIDIAAASSGFVNVNPAGANTAAITSPTGTAISIVGTAGASADLTFRGNVTQANNATLLSVTAGHDGDVLFPSGTLNASNGNGLQFDNADGTYDFDGTVTLNGGDAGIDITNNSDGVFTFPTGAHIASPSTGNLISILNSVSPFSFIYSGTFTKANNNVTGILVSSNAGSSITFNGTGTRSISSGTAAAVNLSSNTGSTITFSGGGLNLTSGTGAGFTATGGGTVQVTDNVNIISSSGGVALNVQNTTIGASGLRFQSISATGGTNGIVLNSTGSNGLQVTGTGSAGTGGTIQNTSGSGIQATSANNLSFSWMNLTNATTADGGTSAGTCSNSNVSTCNAPVDLDNVTGVTLNRLAISGSEEQGIVGNSVTNFVMTNTTVQNAGDEAHEHGMIFTGLFGTNSITSSSVTGSAEANFRALNTSGTSTLTVTGSTFSSNSTGLGGDGFLFDAQGTANATVNVSGSTFAANKDDHFNVTGANSAVVNVTFANNTLSGGNASSVGQGIALRAGGTYAGTFTYDIDNNTINGALPTAINVGFGSTAAGGLLRGKIRNNDVGTSGVAVSGSAQGSCILAEANGTGTGTHTVSITNNIVRRCFDKGIDLLGSRDGSNNLNATVTGNNVDEIVDGGAANSRDAIRLETGSSLTTETGVVCFDASGNTLNAAFLDEIRIRQRSNAVVRLPGYTGGAADDAAVATYLRNRNTVGAGTVTATHTAAAPFQNTSPAGSACPTPP